MTEVTHRKKGLRKGEVLFSKDSKIWRILKELAKSDRNSLLNVKELKHKTRLDYAYCHKRLKLLQRLHFVEERGKKRAEKGDVSVYDLTLKGLLIYLAISQYEDLEKLIKKYGYLLPHVFGEWSYFRKVGVEDVVLQNFKEEVDRLCRQQIITGDINQFEDKPGLSLAEGIDQSTLIPWMIDVFFGMRPDTKTGNFSEKLQTAIRQNADLWNYLKPSIVKARNRTRKILDNLDSILGPL